MKILMITGSPHKTGTSATLAEQFIKGAEEAGHEVYRFDAAYKNVHPCIACNKCLDEGKGCVFKDDMEELNSKIIEAEAVVFATPIYYYAMSAQIKTVMDRFYANDDALHNGRKAVLMTTMADDALESAEGANASFKGMTGFLEWEIAGIINATASGDVEALGKTDYPKQAYELGKSLR